ncbi:hypothetical protein IQ07DRAFT_591739 [Pyrenochaeta sp. DS3sAY3a]|nr:hypothetical protein IQ07DRAFT_591739 [Pyrenochaeta sp. DS3sAY3a]
MDVRRRATKIAEEQKLPSCFVCRGPTEKRITRSSNRNGNAGRPYLKCSRCHKFIAFTDDRGLNPRNPECRCGVPSRTQVVGRDKGVPSGVFLGCGGRGCGFYKICVDDAQNQVCLDEEVIEQLARLRIV